MAGALVDVLRQTGVFTSARAIKRWGIAGEWGELKSTSVGRTNSALRRLSLSLHQGKSLPDSFEAELKRWLCRWERDSMLASLASRP